MVRNARHTVHAIPILDQAGWPGTKDLKAPKNISLLPLPPRAPELNPQENIWQFMRANWLSNRIFKSFDEIVDHCCYAWNTLIDRGKSCPSLAAIGQSPVTHCEGWYNIFCPDQSDFAPAPHGGLFGLDVRRLDDWPPLLNFRFLKSGKCLRRPLFPRWNLLAEVNKPL